MNEAITPPTGRTLLLGTVMELLEMEFPKVDQATLGSIFLACKWNLKKGDPVTQILKEARLLLAEPPVEKPQE